MRDEPREPSAGTLRAERCLDCEEVELANVRDARPSQLLPIPRAALAGFPDGRRPHELTRRRLLQYGAAGLASVYAPRALSFESIWETAAAQATTPRCLLVLYLAGGWDGLNVIVPNSATDYPIYVQKRAVLHRAQGPTTTGANGTVGSTVVPASGGALAFANPTVSASGGGDNGDASFGFDKLYGDGSGGPGSNLALMPATDYMPPNLSHFTSSDYWFGGQLVEPFQTGWLGRWLDLYGSSTNPLQAVSIGNFLSKDIRSSAAPICTLSSLASVGFNLHPGYGPPGDSPASADPNAIAAAMAGAPAQGPSLGRSRSSYAAAVDIYQRTHALGPPTFGAGYPPGGLSPQLELAAFLFAANLGVRIVTIHWGSFDTHGNQLSTQDRQLAELSRALGAFQSDLVQRGIDGQVATLTFSEFGRRVAENGSQGTDHGAGGLMMLSGTPVKGGYAAPFTGLGTLDAAGDLRVGTDYRSVYQAIIAEWLGGDPQAVLPGGPLPSITRYDGGTGLFK